VKQKIIIAGNAITAEILSVYIENDPRYEICGFAVDDEFIDQSTKVIGPTIGLSEVLGAFSPDQYHVIMAMGYSDLNRARQSMFDRLKALDYKMESYIHPDARVNADAPLGEGVVVLPGAVIEPYAQVGKNSMIWSNTTLAHHSIVGENCWLAAGAVISGQAKVMGNTFLGVNSTVVNEITVEEFNIIGAGALITRNTKPYSVHLARSAEPFRYSSEDYVKHFGN